jgi:hypothetical protein
MVDVSDYLALLKHSKELEKQIEDAKQVIQATCDSECTDMCDVGSIYQYCTEDCELFRVKQIFASKENKQTTEGQ